MLTCCRATSSCPPFSRSRLWLPWKSLHRPSEPTANMRLNISSVRQPAQSLPLLPTVVSSYWQAFLASLLPRNHRLPSPLPDNNGRLHSDDPSHEPNMTRSRMVVSPCSYFPSYPSCIDANISRSLQVLMAAVVRSHSIANNQGMNPGHWTPFLSTPGAVSENFFNTHMAFYKSSYRPSERFLTFFAIYPLLQWYVPAPHTFYRSLQLFLHG